MREQNTAWGYLKDCMWRVASGVLLIATLTSCGGPQPNPRILDGPIPTPELVQGADVIIVGTITSFQYGEKIHANIPKGASPMVRRKAKRPLSVRMKELRASGMAYDRIAATLKSDGIPTRTAGKRWHGFAVNQILNRCSD